MKKQLLLLLLLMLSLVTNAADVVIDGVFYNLSYNDKVAEVTSNPNKYSGVVTIPNSFTYGGTEYRVTKIGGGAFLGCSDLTSVGIPESVINIGYRAFAFCTGLTSVDIPYSVTNIEEKAFWNCSNLTSIIIPNSVTYIGADVFASCSNLSSISIGNSVIDIGSGAFSNCHTLTTVIIPNSVSIIRENAFWNCSGLTSVTIPNSVTSIAGGAFLGCSGLKKVIVKDIAAWCGIKFDNSDSNPLYYAHHLYSNEDTEITNLVIPNSVTSIGGGAFADCSGLTSVTIPNSVTSIGNGAFFNCSGLTSVTIPNSVTSIGSAAFWNCSSLKTITISSNVERIKNFAFQECSSLADVFCLSENVPSTHSTAFDKSPIKTAILHIPNKSIHLYKQSSPWSNFGSFVGLYGNEYILSYTVDGESYKSYTLWEDEKIFPEDEPIKEGYTFSGWSEIPESMPAHDLVITGSFSVNSYTLTYKVDGEVYKTSTVAYGTALIPEDAPTKEGYTFSGWSEIPETMPAHDVVVTGTFSVNSYTLTYKVDGEVYKTSTITYGTAITPEDAPTKEGYTFSGWSEIPETMPAHDVVVTGTFSVNSYTLTYKVDGEVYKTSTITYGTAITPETAPTKKGYTFSGWSEIPETMPAHDVTVTGTFSINSYKLTYMVDGEEYKSYDVEYSSAITPETEPTKEGYTFSGWSEIPETMPAHDVTVTGTFSINSYKLTYMVDGEEYKSYDVEYSSAITPETEPTKEGYTFSGWSEIPESMPAHDVTVTGTFTINKYKLTYMVDGEEYKSYELDYGSTITPEKEPTKEGYTFSGWSEIPETMPAHDVTVTGSFSINSYKLTYMIDDKVYKETMYEYGATINPEPQPEGDYATFEWIDLPQTMPAHDVVVHASYTTGIIEVLMATQRNIRIYSPNGKKLNKLQKGLNIVVLADGSVKKVVVK